MISIKSSQNPTPANVIRSLDHSYKMDGPKRNGFHPVVAVHQFPERTDGRTASTTSLSDHLPSRTHVGTNVCGGGGGGLKAEEEPPAANQDEFRHLGEEVRGKGLRFGDFHL